MSDTDAPQDKPKAPDYLIVGQIVAPFGIKGDLKVTIITEFPERLGKLKRMTQAPFSFIEPGLAPTAALNPATVRTWIPPTPGWKAPEKPTPFRVEATQVHKGQLLLKLEGIDTADIAETLRGYWVVIPTEEAGSLPDGAFYIYQVVGLPVYTEAGDLVGHIADVLMTAANDVYVVKGPGVTDPTGELLVPAIKTIVKSIDPDIGKMVIADPREWL